MSDHELVDDLIDAAARGHREKTEGVREDLKKRLDARRERSAALLAACEDLARMHATRGDPEVRPVVMLGSEQYGRLLAAIALGKGETP